MAYGPDWWKIVLEECSTDERPLADRGERFPPFVLWHESELLVPPAYAARYSSGLQKPHDSQCSHAHSSSVQIHRDVQGAGARQADPLLRTTVVAISPYAAFLFGWALSAMARWRGWLRQCWRRCDHGELLRSSAPRFALHFQHSLCRAVFSHGQAELPHDNVPPTPGNLDSDPAHSSWVSSRRIWDYRDEESWEHHPKIQRHAHVLPANAEVPGSLEFQHTHICWRAARPQKPVPEWFHRFLNRLWM